MRKVTEKEVVAYTEVSYILSIIEKEYYNKIPKEIIQLFNKNAVDNYMYYNEKCELKISPLAKSILCYLNLKYWSNEEERKELLQIYKQNEKAKIEKYDINKILENRKNNKKQYN